MTEFATYDFNEVEYVATFDENKKPSWAVEVRKVKKKTKSKGELNAELIRLEEENEVLAERINKVQCEKHALSCQVNDLNARLMLTGKDLKQAQDDFDKLSKTIPALEAHLETAKTVTGTLVKQADVLTRALNYFMERSE